MLEVGIVMEHSIHFDRESFRGAWDFFGSRTPWMYRLIAPQAEQVRRHASSLAGLLVVSRSQPLSRCIAATGKPAVNVASSRRDEHLPQVAGDDLLVGRLAAEHIIERGYRRFAWFGIASHAASRLRLDGVRQAIEQAGLAPESLATIVPDWVGNDGREDDATPLRLALAADSRPIGVMAFNDQRGARVLQHCAQAGLEAPGQIGVIGIDNDEYFCETSRPPLSSIDTNIRQRGYRAAALLADLIAGKSSAPLPRPVPPSRVVVRRSTDFAATGDDLVDEAVQYIRTHVTEGIDVNDVVRHCATNRRTLERRFRRRLGWSPHRQLMTHRIELTKQLLLTTDQPQEEIALTCGFNYRAYMSTAFRKYTGLTPGQFRKRSRPED